MNSQPQVRRCASIAIGPCGRARPARLDEVAHGVAEATPGIGGGRVVGVGDTGQEVGAAEPDRVGTACRPERVTRAQLVDLVEVDVGHRDAVAELVSHRREPSMGDDALVDGASHRRLHLVA